MEVAERMGLFREMIQCSVKMHLWQFDGTGRLLGSNCPEEAIFSSVFSAFGCGEELQTHASRHHEPILLSTALGLTWFGAFAKTPEGALDRVYAMGPVFTTEVSFDAIHSTLTRNSTLSASLAWKKALMDALEQVSVVSPVVLHQLAVMLHYCVTGEKLSVSELFVPHEKIPPEGPPARKDRHKTWRAEQTLLRMVREGDLNYREALSRSANLSGGVPVLSKDPLRQAKTSGIVFTSLCTRAAIEGGLSPEQAYSLGDSYIQTIENCRKIPDIAGINLGMYADFVERVRKGRTNLNLSPQIRKCCDYIESHAEEKLTIGALAKKIGYTEYYLSRKFRAEMNISLGEYIKIAKVERAKFLFDTTDGSIQEVSDRLNFCSRSHFGDVFKSIYGLSPAQYKATGASAGAAPR